MSTAEEPPRPRLRAVSPNAGLLPHDVDAESALLGAMLLSADARATALAELTPDAFYRPAFGHVFSAIRYLAVEGIAADQVTVAGRLRDAGLWDAAGGAETLINLINSVETTANAGAYCRRIVAAHQLRSLVQTGEEIIQRAREAGADADEVAGWAQDRLDTVVDPTSSDVEADWAPQDLTEVLSGTMVPPETCGLTRVDGARCVELGKITLAIGEPESGKSWFAALCAAAELIEGRAVAWVDLEQGLQAVVDQLRTVGVPDDRIAAGLIYVFPESMPTTAQVEALVHGALLRDGRLMVLDSFGELIGLSGVEENNGTEVRALMRRVMNPFSNAGMAVLALDHVVKDTKSRGKYAIGSQGKTSKTDTALRFEVTEPIAPGHKGNVRISVAKNRGGHVARFCAKGKDRVWADLCIDSTGAGMVATAYVPTDAAGVVTGERFDKKRDAGRRPDHAARWGQIAGALRVLDGVIISYRKLCEVLNLGSINTAKKIIAMGVETGVLEFRDGCWYPTDKLQWRHGPTGPGPLDEADTTPTDLSYPSEWDHE